MTEDRFGIGYSGIGYRTSGVKPVLLAGKDGQFYSTEAGDVLSGKYPLSRYLYVYYNAAPNQPLDPLVRENSADRVWLTAVEVGEDARNFARYTP